jgi:hypothetical protein
MAPANEYAKQARSNVYFHTCGHWAENNARVHRPSREKLRL